MRGRGRKRGRGKGKGKGEGRRERKQAVSEIELKLYVNLISNSLWWRKHNKETGNKGKKKAKKPV